MASTTLNFSKSEVTVAWAFAIGFELIFFGLLAWAGENRAHVVEKPPEPKPMAVPINVLPVVDDLPLLKLGSKQPQRKELPDMWKKATPTPVKRYEERSAPSTKAEDKVEELPKSKLADKDHPAPPKDAELAEKVDEKLEDKPTEDAPSMNTEGAADGVKEGTETDPLKARAVSLYQARIAAWFNARFRPPLDAAPCETLKKLSTGVRVSVGKDRSITSFSITGPSGNATYDSKVSAFLNGLIGQELPPPPPLYPDILESSVFPRLSGANADCATAPVVPKTPSVSSGDGSGDDSE